MSEVITMNVLDKKMLDIGFNAMSLHDKNQLILFYAGKNQLNYNDITEEVIFNHHKNLKLAKLSEACEGEILGGFTASNGHTYRTNRDDQVNMIGQKDFLNAFPEETTVIWKTEDVGYIVHTKAEWINIYYEAFHNKRDVLLKYNELKEKVLNATTHEELVGFKWVDGFPQEEPVAETTPTDETATTNETTTV